MNTVEVPVLIVGAGPAGLAMAAGLGRNGVGSLVVEKHATTSTFPKASGISTRTMEVFRAWGVEAAVRAHSLEAEPLMAIRSTMREQRPLAVPLGFPTDSQARAVSPTTPAISPQDHVEPVMLDLVRTLPGVEVRFATELLAVTQDGAGVSATILDRETGRCSTVRARYLVGADGTRSTVRDLLGITTAGPAGLGEYLSILFRADLQSVIGTPHFGLYQLDGPVPGVFVPTGPDDRWVLGLPWDPDSEDLAAYDAARCIELIRAGAGVPNLDVELIATMPSSFVAQAADRTRDGNAFLVGDAAHRMPPMGGRGLNSAIADSAGLAWKVAWVLRGWAHPALLDTYEDERGPVGRHNLALASRQGPPGTPDGLTEDLGYVYRSAAIDPAGADAERTPGYRFPTVAVPGARLPHAWLGMPTGGCSTLDLVGERLTLLTGPDGGAWVDAAADVVGRDGPIPLATFRIGTDLAPADGTFVERYGLGADGAVLVRPDGHIAWRREAGSVSDHRAELRASVDRAVGRPAANPGRVPGARRGGELQPTGQNTSVIGGPGSSGPVR